MQLEVMQVNDVCCDTVEEISVVGNNDECFLPSLQVLLCVCDICVKKKGGVFVRGEMGVPVG